MKKENNIERLILEAADVEFLEKGKNAPTTAIAKRAGVTHSMLHYYFRTKENLFQTIFQKKVQLVGDFIHQLVDENLPFEETVRKLIEFHFDFIGQNPKLLNFIITEIVNNKENKRFFLEEVQPKINKVYHRLNELLIEEVLKGKIKPVKTIDLLLNIHSLNTMTFDILPIINNLKPANNSESFDNHINERKRNNVQFVLKALRV